MSEDKNAMLEFAKGLGAVVAVVGVAAVGLMIAVERYHPNVRPASLPPSPTTTTTVTPSQAPSLGPRVTHDGKQWTPSVDCAAKGGVVTINPSTNRPSCFAP